jgi:hypothetical protein
MEINGEYMNVGVSILAPGLIVPIHPMINATEHILDSVIQGLWKAMDPKGCDRAEQAQAEQEDQDSENPSVPLHEMFIPMPYGAN